MKQGIYQYLNSKLCTCQKQVFFISILLFTLIGLPNNLPAQSNHKSLTHSNSIHSNKIEQILRTKGVVALWDFSEVSGSAYSKDGKYELKEYPNKIQRTEEGPLSGRSITLDGTNYLSLPYSETGLLNIKTNAVTVIAWVKWSGEQTGFVGGMWNEYQDDGKRQYGLFVSLPHYNGKNQVCGHISKLGKPTPPFPYSIDYSASKQTVPANEWCCVGFTYDGEYIKSYFNGVFEAREAELINNTKGFEGYPQGLKHSKNPYYYPDGMGNNGSDFTIGAVLLKRGMGNFFKGQIGGLVVFDRALSKKEMLKLAKQNM